MNTVIIAERIKEIRKYNNLNQEQFGRKMGVSQDTVSLWETGKSLPSVEQIINIIEGFKLYDEDIPADYLLGIKEL